MQNKKKSHMSKKIAIFTGIVLYSILLLCIGFYASFLAVTAIEGNDRLKYEAAYLKGYVRAQKLLKQNEYARAEGVFDFMIDAHANTLSEFRYLESSIVSDDINSVLCEASELRKEYPREREAKGEELVKFYNNIDEYLTSIGETC